MDIAFIIVLAATILSFGLGIELKDRRHKKRVERNYQEYKSRIKK